jgi:DNA-binding transcriptional LysR family regulator
LPGQSDRHTIDPAINNAADSARFCASTPDVRVDISGVDYEKIERDVCSGIFDIGISSLGAMAGYACTKLFSDPFGVICRGDHLLARD